jgi:RHS repeat-associated protein
LSSITYPSGRQVSYQRNAIGQVTGVTSTYQGNTTTVADTITRLPFGPVTSTTLGNVLVIKSGYDQQYRLISAAAGDIYNRAYTYLATGQVENISDVLDTGRSQAFSYDDLGRLTGATGSYGSLGFSYDLVGNRLSKTDNGLVNQYTYQPNSNKIDQIAGDQATSYSYDTAGNTLAKGDLALTWNEDNHLKQIDINAETAGSYGYDARGLRTVKTTAEGTILSIYDTAGNLLAETDEAGTTIREFVYLDSQRLTLFDYTIPPEFTVNVITTSGTKVPNVRTYAFDETNNYTGIYGTTDEHGVALFTRGDFGEGSYHFRVDYLGAQFWSDKVVVQDTSSLEVIIEDEPVGVNVVMDGEPQEGVKVYAFTESGSYLGIYSVTDENGQVSFNLPEGQNYKFRADLLGSQYWSDSSTIVAGGPAIEVNTGGGAMSITVQEGPSLPLSGIKTYLFSASGSYLGKTVTSDAEGNTSYRVSGGSYKIRADYLGYQFWSEVISVTDSATVAALTIPHLDVNITVSADLAGTLSPLADITCYLFSPTGSYLSINAKTNTSGLLSFHLPEQPYRLRADYLGQQFWSEDFTWQDSSINIPHGTGVIEVIKMGAPLEGIKVYAFSHSGTYLGLNDITDNAGKVRFVLPTGEYRFRADYQGSQYWGENLALVAHQDNPVQISTGGGSFVLTVLEQAEAPIEGVRAYVFSEAGAYLGEYANTDSNGQVGFNLSDGSYKMRVDYLDKQYWTSPVTIPTDSALDFTIEHRQVQVSAVTEFSGTTVALSGVKVYLFTSTGTYLGLNATTDNNGQAAFHLPQDEYQVRVDYLGKQYFSEVFSTDEISVNIKEGQALVHLQSGETALADVPVYVFSESDSYLGITGKTATDGSILFQLPAGLYKFRADYQSSNFWASDQVVADTVRDIYLQTGGGTLAVTVRTDEATVLSGVSCYLFNNLGTDLGQTATTDENGLVSFDVADGSYKIRVDYLGAQYWSASVGVPGILSTTVLIEHRDVTVSVGKQWGDSPTPMPGVKCYLFTEAGAYTGITTTTDENGEAHFSLPYQNYQVRADYLGSQYWSDLFIWHDASINIAHGELVFSVYDSGTAINGASVYLFTEAGSYLGLSSTTDNAGQVHFIVPEAGYTLRIDVNGEQYWTTVINVLPSQQNDYQLDLTADSLTLDPTNNPRPTRWDGKPLVYMPLLATSDDSLSGLLAQTTTEVLVGDEARPFWYITDHLGTAQLIMDKYGRVIWQGNYRPFGAVDVVVDQLDNLFRFPGQVLDSESGLYYNWHRFYDPETGRYISADPIGLAGGINLYSYVQNDPVNFVDPWGLAYSPAEHGGRYEGGAGGFVQLTTGGAVHGGPVGFQTYTGYAIDSDCNFCSVYTICETLGLGVYGAYGLALTAGTGTLSSGKSESSGVFIEGGEGVAGSGTVLTNGKDVTAGKLFFGEGGGAAGGSISCVDYYICD